MKLNLRRRQPVADSTDRAVIEQQRELLAEAKARIEELEFELLAARLLGDRDLVVESHRYLTAVYRAQLGFVREQLNLAFEILEARKKRAA